MALEHASARSVVDRSDRRISSLPLSAIYRVQYTQTYARSGNSDSNSGLHMLELLTFISGTGKQGTSLQKNVIEGKRGN
jgi:hypothetical protein